MQIVGRRGEERKVLDSKKWKKVRLGTNRSSSGEKRSRHRGMLTSDCQKISTQKEKGENKQRDSSSQSPKKQKRPKGNQHRSTQARPCSDQ